MRCFQSKPWWIVPLFLWQTFATAADRDTAGKPLVLTSFLPIHSLTVAVAGNRAQVENWIPPGVDPHEFQFRARDLKRLSNAALVVTAGCGLEGWREAQLREMSGNPRLRLVEVAARLSAEDFMRDTARLESSRPAGSEGPPNPHFWLDPLLFARVTTVVTEALAAIDPAGRRDYEANASNWVARLSALNVELETGLRECREVPFLTYHDAFPYLAKRYGLKLVGVVEPAAEQQPSAHRLAQLSELVKGQKVKILYTSAQPGRLARQLASDLRLKLAVLDTLETGNPGPRAYEDGMRRNLKVLRETLEPLSPGH